MQFYGSLGPVVEHIAWAARRMLVGFDFVFSTNTTKLRVTEFSVRSQR